MAALAACHHLLPKYTAFSMPLAQHCRRYALSRFPHRNTGFGRSSRDNTHRRPQSVPHPEDLSRTSGYEEQPPPLAIDHSQLWRTNMRRPATDPEVGLKHLLSSTDELVVTRRLEMLNIFMGFEQSNRYVITNPAGETLGYIAEEPKGFLSMFARQVFRTHRPFRALVMDLEGSPILWIRRPFAWINSRMFVQRPKDYTPDCEPILDTFAEVQQEWHLWRRRYDLFLRSTPQRVLTTLGSDSQTEPTSSDTTFNQFARVDEGLWAWHFVLRDAHGGHIASIDRAFRGFGREIFTDTGQYTVSFQAPEEQSRPLGHNSEVILHRPSGARTLAIEERALVLAMAGKDFHAIWTPLKTHRLHASVNIDYDFFSRHSGGGHGFGFWLGPGE